jgi:hypothetical protein
MVTIVDLHRDEELSSYGMSKVAGGEVKVPEATGGVGDVGSGSIAALGAEGQNYALPSGPLGDAFALAILSLFL